MTIWNTLVSMFQIADVHIYKIEEIYSYGSVNINFKLIIFDSANILTIYYKHNIYKIQGMCSQLITLENE